MMTMSDIRAFTDLFTNSRLDDIPFYMKHRVTDKHFFMNMHSHRGHELYFLHAGTGMFLTEDRIYPMQGNDLFLVESLEAHKSSPQFELENTRTVVNFLPEMLDPLLKEPFLQMFDKRKNTDRRHLRLKPGQDTRIFDLIELLHHEYHSRPKDFETALRVHLNGLLFEIYRLVHADSAPDHQTLELNPINPKVEEIVRHLSLHFNEDIDLEELAAKFYINQYYLCHLFKKSAGITITDFVVYTRIHHAKRHLIHTSLSISEIAEMVGFNSFSYFGQVFKSLEGVTPRGYRKHFSNPAVKKCNDPNTAKLL